MGNLNFNGGSKFYPNLSEPYSLFQDFNSLNRKFLLSSFVTVDWFKVYESLFSSQPMFLVSPMLFYLVLSWFIVFVLENELLVLLRSTLLRSTLLRSVVFLLIQCLFSFFFSPLLVDLLNLLNIDDNFFRTLCPSIFYQWLEATSTLSICYILVSISSFFSFSRLDYSSG